MVDQLALDLRTLERRQRERSVDAVDDEELIPLREAFEKAESNVQVALHDRGKIANELSRAQEQHKEAEARFTQTGGMLRYEVDALELKRKQIRLQVEESESILRDHAAGIAPLLMVRHLFPDNIQPPHMLSRHPKAIKALEERDNATLQKLRDLGGNTAMAKALQKYLQSDRLQLKESLPNAEQVDLSEVLADLSLAEVAIGADLKLFSASISRLDEIDSTLSRMPAADVVEQPKQLWEASVRGLAKAELQLEQADQALEESRRLRTRAVERYSAVLERRVKSKHGHEKITLAISRSESIRGVLATFREKVAQRHATRLGELIGDCFNQLHRKSGVVKQVTIDVSDFSMVIHTDGNEPLAADKLSAGERQLLAIATIWAILRASGRPLPLVIDTPLGRLDSVHRQSLVSRFFAHASHQVILLATDTELDANVQTELAPFVAAEYEISYDSKAHGSQLSRRASRPEQPSHLEVT